MADYNSATAKKAGFNKTRLIIITLVIFGLVFAQPVVFSAHLNADITGNQRLPIFIYFIIAGLVIALGSILVWYSSKLRKLNVEIKEKIAEAERLYGSNQNKSKVQEEEKSKPVNEISGSESFFNSLLDSASDGISFYDNDWTLKYANKAFYSMIGYDEKTYLLVNPYDLVHPEDLQYFENRKKEIERNGIFEGEIRLKHCNGNFVFISTKSVMVRDSKGNPLGSLTISRDVTTLRKYHQELIQAKVEAETSNKLKASFLANISHEIRTPLNSVVGFSNLLLADDIDSASKSEYVDHINFNSEKLLQIIGDIIDLSRLESSQVEITYEETSLSEIVNEVVDETRKSIKRNEKPIILLLKNQFDEHSDLIFTDRVWLKRVLNHLMDNAVKFTLEGSIEFSYSKEESNILFKVKDTGIGIKKENLSRIFEEFRQEIDGHHRPFEGLGVGLTLAREVVERMGGSIGVESEKGLGSEFSFTIPFRPAGSSRLKIKSDLQPLETAGWSTKKCLLVDDNKDVLIYLNRILSDTGINVIMARSGEEAIGIIKTNPDIDVVLLDMQMPEMNGIEVTREIRKIRNSIPIIAQTAFVFEDDKDIILEAGCDACLIKPIRKDHLFTVLSGFLKPN